MKPLHLLVFALFGISFADDTPKLPLIAITQLVEHDALTKEREGVVEALKDAGFENGKTAIILYENAQGNIATASQIAAGFASRQPTVAVGISTPSAQSLIQPMAKQGVPVVFAAVTDPVEARLVSSLDTHSENVTGVSDGMPLHPQLELIQKLLPKARIIGVIYNPGEANSAKGVSKLQELAPTMGFSLVFATTAKTSDTMSAVQSLVGRADVIFIPNDNTAMASITGIVSFGRANGLPVFTPDYDSVEQGVLAVRAASHKTMGYKAGQMAAKILKGEMASNLPVEVDHQMDLAINVPSAEQLGITIPEDLKKEAKLVL